MASGMQGDEQMNGIQAGYGADAYGFGQLFGLSRGAAGGSGSLMGNGRVSVAARQGEDVSAVFAADVVSRITPPDTERLQGPEALAGFGEDEQGLAGALQRTVEHVQERYGKEAATAVMGMMYSRIAEGGVTEDSLGKGLLDSVRFIDRNFGMAEGDAFMAELNGDLNEQMNAYFDNGLSERFFAATPGTASISQSFSTALATVAKEAGQDTADGILALLEPAMADTENPLEALKAALSEADGMLGEEHAGLSFTGLLAQNVAQGEAALAPKVGTLLDLTV